MHNYIIKKALSIAPLLFLMLISLFELGCADTKVNPDAPFISNSKVGYMALAVQCAGGAAESTLSFRNAAINRVANHFGVGTYSHLAVNCYEHKDIQYYLQKLPVGVYMFTSFAQPYLGKRLVDLRFNVLPNEVSYIGRLHINASEVKAAIGAADLQYKITNNSLLDLAYFHGQYKSIPISAYKTRLAVR